MSQYIQEDRAEALRDRVSGLEQSPRVLRLQEYLREETRYVSVEQAWIITRTYREHRDEPRVLQRAHALAASLREITIRIDPEELIVGNRTPGVRAGVVFPEAGISWVNAELDSLAERDQDPFRVRPEDATTFRSEILPVWQGSTLEDEVARRLGPGLREVESVVKINQTDHAQGHISPHSERWLRLGPAGLLEEARERRAVGESTPGTPGADAAAAGTELPAGRPFLDAVIIVLEAARDFIRRYAEEAEALGREDIADSCNALAERPAETFREALQSLWFLYVVLQMESNASSFSPGRVDQYLLPYLERDLESGRIDLSGALELLEALWLNFNKIVYMRSASSAEYFAGFPIGFNVAIGGVTPEGEDATNILSFLILKAQEHLDLPQPNLSARLWRGSPESFVDECARVIGLGSGMPQVVNDESIVPALERLGIGKQDARNYAVVGCVELSTQGNNLGWSDAAMFNMVKVLELSLNDGVCMLTGRQLGLRTGLLQDFADFGQFVQAFRRQLDFFMDRMIPLCDAVDRLHAEMLPSPFLSSVVEDCLEKELDVTAGGARYNLSGIQAIQVANVADSLAALEKLVFPAGDTTSPAIHAAELLEALRNDFADREALRRTLQERAPKYGNDLPRVDEIGRRWVRYFADRLSAFTNARGGPYHMGLYTVSAHVPMGKNVGATPDGRRAREPLADGGMSAVYGRDTAGPTALLQSVSRINAHSASNGTLLNMKFLPRTFHDPGERQKFVALLRGLVDLHIHHVQFNVVNRETLLAAKERPEEFENLTIRVAGYTAYFVELAEDLQDEIISRTAYSF